MSRLGILLLSVMVLNPVAAAEFVGTRQCLECHLEEYRAWENSHHDLAMQEVNEQTVLGDFDNAQYQYNGITTTFSRDSGEYWVTTDGPDGRISRFPVRYVFGVYPLQQYLLPLPGGRLQALTLAWDSRPEAVGGQRWYHLYPDGRVDHNDPLHWTGPYQNWNARCAECHSTNVRKGYDASSKNYQTQFDALDVGCEGCHGPGGKHISAARSGKLPNLSHAGFLFSIGGRGLWQITAGDSTAKRVTAHTNGQIDTCARCHSRRKTLGHYDYGNDLLETHSLTLPTPPFYHIDGQILDEVYVYGSFLQSKMYTAGVVCTDCHAPHSNKLHAEGNALCTQCHKAEAFDTAKHHHHSVRSAGGRCVNCHMPESIYMGIDGRRDHSIRIPRPDLSVTTGVPNACTQCHVEQSASWAVAALKSWNVELDPIEKHKVELLFAVHQGDIRAHPELAQLALNPNVDTIWRGTAVEMLGDQAAGQTSVVVEALMRSHDPLLRASAVRSLGRVSLRERYRLLQPFLKENNTSVAMEIATMLAGVPLDQLPQNDRMALQGLFEGYLSVQAEHTDMPAVLMQLGRFHSDRGDIQAAEDAYREALQIDGRRVAAYLNLADLIRNQGNESGARNLISAALEVAPNNADAHHAMGLLEVRRGNLQLALSYLKRAADLGGDDSVHYRYVYAVALHDVGEPVRAIAELESALASAPRSVDVLTALVNYLAELRQYNAAIGYAERLAVLRPDNASYTRFLKRLKLLLKSQQ